MIAFLIEFCFPLIFVALIIYVAILQKNKLEDWRSKFQIGTKVYTDKEEEGVIISIKNNKAFVKFYHGNYWRYLDDLIPYNEHLD